MSKKAQTLTEAAELHATERRAQAAAKYRELLLRNDAGDAEALVEVLTVLGRDRSNLQNDLELVQRLAEHERLATSVERLEGALIRKHSALDKALREVEQAHKELEQSIEAKLAPLQAARAQAEAKLKEATQARSNLGLLRDEWTAIEQGVDLEEVRAARQRSLRAKLQRPFTGPALPRTSSVR